MSNDAIRVKSKSHYEYDKQPALILSALYLLVYNDKFLGHYRPLLDAAHWGEPELKWIIAACVENWDRHGAAPLGKVLRYRLDGDRDLTDEQHQLVTRVINKIDDMDIDAPTRAYIKDTFEPFVRYRATLHALHEAQELLQDGDTEAAVEAVQKSQMVRLLGDDWLELPNDADKFWDFFNEDALIANTIPIGLKKLDDKLNGGARKGELGVWVAPTGYGKSMALVHSGANAYRKGLNVVHFTFENSKEETLARYLYNLLEVESGVLPNWNRVDERYIRRRNEMSAIPGNLKIMQLIGSQTTCVDLAGYLDRLGERGEKPDLVIVDYGDFLRSARPSTRQSKKYEELQTVFEELRDLAASQNVVVWTATQANREGLKGKRVLTHHIADSLGKAMVADIIISISMEAKDKNGKAITTASLDAADNDDDAPTKESRILHLLKLRRGAGDWWMPVTAHYSQAKFEAQDWDGEPDESELEKTQGKYRLKSVRKKEEGSHDSA